MDSLKRPIACHDCRLVFDTHKELQQHILHGRAHKNCAVCGKYFGGQNPKWILQRIGHTRVTGHGHRCEACDLILWSVETLEEHRKDEHVCPLCKTTCENAEEYEKHFAFHSTGSHQSATQEPRSNEIKRIECIGCNHQYFKSYSKMIKHIELDKCPSDIDWICLAVALLKYEEHWRYAYFEVRDAFLDDIRDGPGAVSGLKLFFCPGEECQHGPFRDFFLLLRHIEEDRCDFSIEDEFMVDLFKYLYEELSVFRKPGRRDV